MVRTAAGALRRPDFMSVNNFLIILSRALEVREHRDAADRRNIYETSRRTLERFFEQNPSMDAANRAQQRSELEAAIAEIERRFAEVPARPLPPDAAPTQALASQPPASPAAPPVPAKPPAAPLAPAEPVPNPATDGQALAAVEPAKDHRHHDPKTVEAFFVADGDIEPPANSDEEVSENEEVDLRSRNRRGTILLGVVALGLGLAYETGLLELGRRLMVGGSLPSTNEKLIARDPEDIAATGEWTRIASRYLADTGEPDRTAAMLRSETSGTVTQDFSGEITWKRRGTDDVPELDGELVVSGSPVKVEILAETDTRSIDGFARLIMIAIDGAPESILEVGSLQRVDPATGLSREVDGISTRIGLNRILYGLRPIDADGDPRFEARPLFQFTVTLESGVRLRMIFRMPPPK